MSWSGTSGWSSTSHKPQSFWKRDNRPHHRCHLAHNSSAIELPSPVINWKGKGACCNGRLPRDSIEFICLGHAYSFGRSVTYITGPGSRRLHNNTVDL
jgi:hypothetical protein